MDDWTTMFDAALEVGPGLGDPQLGAIPAKRGVLALLGEGNQPILLLTAADIRARLRSRLSEPVEAVRKKSADLREITRKILWKLSASHFETDLNYFELARAIWPASGRSMGILPMSERSMGVPPMSERSMGVPPMSESGDQQQEEQQQQDMGKMPMPRSLPRTYTELLAWRPAWLVHVDPREKFPHFVRTREVGSGGGICLGPFESGHGAEKFIGAIEDAFDLCRDYQCLRQAPRGQPCAYLQMGRCVGPCNGTISLEEYRAIVERAAAFALGRREELVRSLQTRMKEAAAALEYEKASALKARLDRLEEFNAQRYRHVAPLEQFRFLIVQPGAGRKQADVFLVNGPEVLKAAPLDYPLVESQLGKTLQTMAELAQRPFAQFDQAGLWRMGLVSHYLFNGPDRAGVILRWRQELAPADLRTSIEAAREALHLGKPKPQEKPSGEHKPDAQE